MPTNTAILPPIDLDELILERAKLKQRRLAPSTLRSYRTDWKSFSTWCEQAHLASLPATTDTVSLYVTDLIHRGRKVATAIRRCTGLQHRHKAEGYPSPVTREIWSLLLCARRLRCEQPEQKRPLTLEQLRKISTMLGQDESIEAARDRAVIVMGFASALRRSSLAELLLSDVAITECGAVLHIRREKQDQEGHGRWIGLPYGEHVETCPVRCLRAWLDVRGDAEGPLFLGIARGGGIRRGGMPLSPQAIGDLVQKAVERIGLDPKDYGGHSLRAGFVTAAAEAGVSDLMIATQTGHRNMAILRGYLRHTDVFRANPCVGLGL